jgi:hypothetical protein
LEITTSTLPVDQQGFDVAQAEFDVAIATLTALFRRGRSSRRKIYADGAQPADSPDEEHVDACARPVGTVCPAECPHTVSEAAAGAEALVTSHQALVIDSVTSSLEGPTHPQPLAA